MNKKYWKRQAKGAENRASYWQEQCEQAREKLAECDRDLTLTMQARDANADALVTERETVAKLRRYQGAVRDLYPGIHQWVQAETGAATTDPSAPRIYADTVELAPLRLDAEAKAEGDRQAETASLQEQVRELNGRNGRQAETIASLEGQLAEAEGISEARRVERDRLMDRNKALEGQVKELSELCRAVKDKPLEPRKDARSEFQTDGPDVSVQTLAGGASGDGCYVGLDGYCGPVPGHALD